jgi:hypothetical protein
MCVTLLTNLSFSHTFELPKHKLGADAVETFSAIPVQSENRLKDAGPAREIQVTPSIAQALVNNSKMKRVGQTFTFQEGQKRCVSFRFRDPAYIYVLVSIALFVGHRLTLLVTSPVFSFF